jgi:LDH2 family malate/lactate/ureidoglycolate dehydrogenase
VTPTNTGQAIVVFRPDLFLDAETYARRMDAVLHDFRTSESMTDEPVTLPGQRAQRAIAENSERGIPLPHTLVAALRQLARDVGVDSGLPDVR